MKYFCWILMMYLACLPATAQIQAEDFITSDIANFWEAYDKIKTTQDSAQQYHYLQTLYLDKASEGLLTLMQVRQYTAQSYIEAIQKYPQFWQSIRKNTLQVQTHLPAIQKHLAKFKTLYPKMRPAKAYYTIGALRTGGTGVAGKLLIGTEIALADATTIIDEFPSPIRENRKKHFATNSAQNFELLNVHEFIHTQQRAIGGNLLAFCMYEGVAEFISCLITGIPSSTPAVRQGKKYHQKIIRKFEQDMFNEHKAGLWLWSDQTNEFNMRDLGYYVGYAFCEQYYTQAKDKKEAIRTLLELDYEDTVSLEYFINTTDFFSARIAQIATRFEASRPFIIDVQPFESGSQTVSPDLTEITLQFSEAMDTRFKSTGLGAAGKASFPQVSKITFGADGKTVTYHVALEPQKNYEILLESGYRTPTGIGLRPYLLTFRTASK